MTYKLEPIIEKIRSPIKLCFPDGEEQSFSSGEEAAGTVFNAHYVISKITAVGPVVEIEVEELRMPEVTWVGEEEVSFF